MWNMVVGGLVPLPSADVTESVVSLLHAEMRSYQDTCCVA